MKNQKMSQPDSNQGRKKTSIRSSSSKPSAETDKVEEAAGSAHMALRQEILYKVLRAVSGQLNLQLLAQSATETLAQITNYPHVCLALPDKNGTHWVVRGAAGSLADEIGATYPIHQGVIGRAFKTAQMQWVRDNLKDPVYVRVVSKTAPALRSEIVVLLKHDNRLLGALNIESDRVDAFDHEDVELIQALAEVITLGVENAQLYQDAQLEITERMRAEEAIKASEEKLRTLFNIMSEGVALNEIIYDENGEMSDYRILEVNEAFYKMADYEPGRVIGNVASRLYGMSREVIKSFWEGRKKASQVVHTEFVSPRSNRTYIISTSPFQNGRFVTSFFDITERKQAEMALLDSRAMQNAIFNSTADFIWSVDSGRFGLLTFNHGLSDYFLKERGISIKVGDRPEELFPPGEFVERWKVMYQHALSEGSYTVQYQVFAGTHTLELTFNLLKREDKVFGISVFGRDISEQKQAEQKLAQSNERFRQLFENSGAGIITIDENGKYLLVNKIAAASLGKTPQEVAGKSMFDFLPHEVAGHYLEFNRQLIRSGGGREYEDTFQLPSGQRSFLIKDQCIQDENGRNFAIQSSSIDITERTQAEERLRESEERYRDLVENSHELIYTHDLHGRLLSVNHTTALTLGFTATGLVGRNLGELLAPEQRPQFEAYLGKVRRRISDEGTWVLQSVNGERRLWEYHSMLRSEAKQGPYVRGTAHDITERTLAETALRDSEERFHKIFEEGPIGITLTSRDLKFLSANPAFCRMLGYPTAEINTKTLMDVTHPEHHERDRQNMEKLWRGEIPAYRTEERYIAKNGEIRWGSLSTTLIRGQAGEPLYALAIVEDITERKRAEGKLHESETSYRAVFDGVEDAIFVESMDSRILDANRRACEMFGYSRAELLNKMVADLVPSKDYIVSFHPDESPILPMYPFETVNVRANGEQFPIELNIRMQSLNGQAVLFVVGRDISERKRAEQALHNSEERFKQVAEQSGEWIWEVDTQGLYTYASPIVAQILGHSPEELVGKKHFYDLFIPEKRERMKEAALEAFARKDPIKSFVNENVHKDGRIVILETNGIPICDATGALLGYRGADKDITERKQAEAELAQSHEQLRALSQYLQATREEERTFIAREIHDELGQQLTALKMDLAWLARQLPPDQARLIQKTSAMSEMVDGTIQTVRRVASELRPGMLDDLGLVAALDWQAGEFQTRTGIHCKLTLPENVTTLNQDQATAIFRIFQETLTNIARHAQATKVRVALKEQPESIELAVHDNGIGITQDKLTDPRSLGLTGMRERVQAFGGALEFKSAPGKGTSVRLRMPVVNMRTEKEA